MDNTDTFWLLLLQEFNLIILCLGTVIDKSVAAKCPGLCGTIVTKPKILLLDTTKKIN